ncbi:NUDIX domain-containing protein [candidate division WWE3 bacterium]|uniref:NUDIX domain-containing protein n=1 Tax=candidate division WWE3 bacterium TaxID=2053526 RepID=A0A955LGZ5_UNCKA|nr:NUDIX domain-containing protein [candidate division WWE3 bacterium]
MVRTRSAGVIIKDSQILLMHRIKNGQEYFVFPGGKVEPKESTQTAVRREIFEEVSLTITTLDECLYQRSNEDGDEEIYYLVTDFTGEIELSGEEKGRMNDLNQYYPEWWKIAEAINLQNLVPREVVEPIFSRLEQLGYFKR